MALGPRLNSNVTVKTHRQIDVTVPDDGFGMLGDRMVVVGNTPRGTDRQVFSLKKANDRKQALIALLLGI